MRLYISADIEGVTGMAHWDEADKAHADYAWFRERMHREVAATCDGALAGGATAITIKDAHASGRNLHPDRFDGPVSLIRGWSGHPYGMVQDIDGSYAGLAVVGYHSPGTSGGNPLSHTLTGRYARVEINGNHVSELLLSVMTAQAHGVPTLFVAGDAGLCAAAEQLVPDVVVVATGHGVGHSTVSRPAAEVLDALREGMTRAMQLPPSPPVALVSPPFTLVVRFRVPHAAYRASHYPGAEAVADDHVRLVATEWIDVLRALTFW